MRLRALVALESGAILALLAWRGGVAPRIPQGTSYTRMRPAEDAQINSE
jgi:hypothetical protein